MGKSISLGMKSIKTITTISSGRAEGILTCTATRWCMRENGGSMCVAAQKNSENMQQKLIMSSIKMFHGDAAEVASKEN